MGMKIPCPSKFVQLPIAHKLLAKLLALTTVGPIYSLINPHSTIVLIYILSDSNKSIELVEEMLADIRQVPSIEKRFADIEEKIEQRSNMRDMVYKAGSNTSNAHYNGNQFENNYRTLMPQSDITSMKPVTSTVSSYIEQYPDPITIAEMTNELEERNKRNKGLVIHNLPEGGNDSDEEKVLKLLCEVLDSKTNIEVDTDEYTSKLRIYRLGKKQPNKVRSLKIHMRSARTRDQILENARRLSHSYNFNNIVIQKDMTPLERIQLKRLVYEKNRRNHVARMNHEDANWTIRGGVICQKNSC